MLVTTAKWYAFAGTLFLGNSVYMYLSVAFIQMLKSLGTVAVFSTGCIFGVEQFSLSALANMVRQHSIFPQHKETRSAVSHAVQDG